MREREGRETRLRGRIGCSWGCGVGSAGKGLWEWVLGRCIRWVGILSGDLLAGRLGRCGCGE
jgi:hypothetical protein